MKTTFKKVYNITVNDTKAQAYVNVHLYRDKSQVEYEIHSIVSADSKGNTSYDAAAIEQIKKVIFKAANS